MKRESRVGRRGQPTRGRSGGGTCGERKTRTVCHCHEHQTFAPSGAVPRTRPFFASALVPSMKHSDRSSFPRSFRSRANASRMRSYVPSRTQRWNRRWHVWYGGYRSGTSAHWAPVRQIHGIPLPHLAAAAPGTSPAIGSLGQVADERFEYVPLFVRQIHDGCILLIRYSVSPIYEITCSITERATSAG